MSHLQTKFDFIIIFTCFQNIIISASVADDSWSQDELEVIHFFKQSTLWCAALSLNNVFTFCSLPTVSHCCQYSREAERRQKESFEDKRD